MKALISIIGILLIVFGIATLGYRGYYTYTSQEKIAEIGNVKVTADTEKTIYFSPVTGGIALIAGIVLVIVGRNGLR